MSDSFSIFEVTSVFTDAETRNRVVIDSLLAFSNDRVTLTFRIPGCDEVYRLSVNANCEQVVPLRDVVQRAYQDATAS